MRKTHSEIQETLQFACVFVFPVGLLACALFGHY